MSTHLGSGTTSGTEKCLGELGVGMDVGVGVAGAMAESAGGDAAAVVAGVLMSIISVADDGDDSCGSSGGFDINV
ncbi:Hypothetical predicted protein [Octopus vulgaris]|uniref:Uncharacterized protein n=1 Tax=Octopus vulgaris TaxID=6645 RepID=A0AA36FB79_OCTVU|nr:Hypothetical predicted protein [Octopus vulgaris]